MTERGEEGLIGYPAQRTACCLIKISLSWFESLDGGHRHTIDVLMSYFSPFFCLSLLSIILLDKAVPLGTAFQHPQMQWHRKRDSHNSSDILSVSYFLSN